MKNCPKKGCGQVTSKPHCATSPTCTWWVCVDCKIVFDASNLAKQMEWTGK